MRARYKGAEGATDAFGHVFPHGKWEDVDHLDDHAKERLAEHPHFDVEGHEAKDRDDDEPEAPAAAPKPKAVRKRRKARPAPKAKARHAPPATPAADAPA